MRRTLRLGCLTLALVVAGCAGDGFDVDARVDCRITSTNILVAQSVPAASYVPCIERNDEFTLRSQQVDSGGSRFELDAARSGGTWTVTLADRCAGAGDGAEAGDEPPEPAIDESTASGRVTRTATYAFEGGCVTSTLDLPDSADVDLVIQAADQALDLLPRPLLADAVSVRTDGELPLDPS